MSDETLYSNYVIKILKPTEYNLAGEVSKREKITVKDDFSAITSVNVADYISDEEIDLSGNIIIDRYKNAKGDYKPTNPVLAKIIEYNNYFKSGILSEEVLNQKISVFLATVGDRMIENNPALQFDAEEQDKYKNLMAEIVNKDKHAQYEEENKQSSTPSKLEEYEGVDDLLGGFEEPEKPVVQEQPKPKTKVTKPVVLEPTPIKEDTVVLEEETPLVHESQEPVIDPNSQEAINKRIAENLPSAYKNILGGLKKQTNPLSSVSDEEEIDNGKAVVDEDIFDEVDEMDEYSEADDLVDGIDVTEEEDDDDIFAEDNPKDKEEAVAKSDDEEEEDTLDLEEVDEVISSNDYEEITIDAALGNLNKLKKSTMKFLELQGAELTSEIALPRSGLKIKIKKLTQESLSRLQMNLVAELDTESIFNTSEVIRGIRSETSLISNHRVIEHFVNELSILLKYKKMFSKSFVESVIYDNINFVGTSKDYLKFDSFYMILDPIDCINLVTIIGLMVNSDYDYDLGCINPDCDLRYYDYFHKDVNGKVTLQHKIGSDGEYMMNPKVAKKVSLKNAEIFKSETYKYLVDDMNEKLFTDSSYSVANIKKFRIESNRDWLKHTDDEITLYNNKEDKIAINAQLITTRITLGIAHASYSQRAYDNQIGLLNYVKEVINNVTENLSDSEITAYGGKPSLRYIDQIDKLYNKIILNNLKLEKNYIRTIFAKNKELYTSLIFLFEDENGRKTKAKFSPKDAIRRFKDHSDTASNQVFISTLVLSSVIRVLEHINNPKYVNTSITVGLDRANWQCPSCGEDLGINSDPTMDYVDDRENTSSKIECEALGLTKYKTENFLGHLILPNVI